MPAQIVPLSNAPNQSLRVTLSIDGKSVPLQLNVRFNRMAGMWMLSIFDGSGNLKIDSVPLIANPYPAANLVPPALAIGSWQVINVSGVAQEYPGSTNLGTDFQVLVDDTPT